MSEKVEPALTPEEWAYAVERWRLDDGPSRYVSGDDRCYAGCRIPESDYHATAALCLHGQPFGFTRADVESVRYVSDWLDRPNPLRDLADRIEALLPPHER